ncbi:MAG: zf-TFIIB domain-containing protein [Candidatus Altiarchaeota archaeon]|nr:zf-TFIIB domain-containing protein [Candidatus Altiarchaeota archaeon]
MKCPKDASDMLEVKIEGIVFDFCSLCQGYWMDWGELSKTSSNMVTEHELIYRGESKRLCPKCGKHMRKADLHSVIVEECSCGIFFDKGEAQKVLGAVGKKLESEHHTKKKEVVICLGDLKKLEEDGKIELSDVVITLGD